MTSNFLDRFLSLGSRPDSSPNIVRKGRLTNGLCAVGIIFLAAFGCIALIDGARILALMDFASALTLLVLLVAYWSTGRFDLGAHVGAIAIGLVFLYLLMTGGNDQTGYLFCFVFPLFSTFVLGAWKGIVASAVWLAIGSVYFGIDPLMEGWADYTRAFEIRFAASYAIVALFSFIYEKQRNDAALALEEQTRALQTTVNNLTEARTNLSTANEQLRDEIQQRTDAVAEMEGAFAQARHANEAKSQFLANMSHELRTPLNHVIGFSEIVADEKVGGLNKVQHEYLGDVISSGRHLLSIINDILDLSRVESGKAEMTYGDVDPSVLLSESLSIVEDLAEKKGVRLKVDTSELPANINVDERIIRQVIYNLLQNAVKFTDRGGLVTLSGRISGVSDNSIHVSVTDTGIGLDSEDIERVFVAFEQVAGEHQGTLDGTGLGLALSRRFIESHLGRIWVYSDGPGLGCTFTFSIPIRPNNVGA